MKTIHIISKWVLIGTIFLLLCCLMGCAKKPTQTIVDEHVNHVNEVLDYAKNNFEQTIQVKFLENELENCKTGLVSCGSSYSSEIATCEAKTAYWRLSSTGLLVALCVAIFLLIKRKI